MTKWRNPSFLRDIGQDADYAFRLFRKDPASFAIAVLGGALALGLSVSLLAALNAVRFPPVRVTDAASLMWVKPVASSSNATGGVWTFREFVQLRAGLGDIGFAAIVDGSRDVRTAEGSFRTSVPVAFVSSDFFEVMRARPRLGRLLDASDQLSGQDVAVLSHDVWSRLFEESTGVLGTAIRVGEQSFIVVGVAERGFGGPSAMPRPAIWLPTSSLGGGRQDILQATFPRVVVRLETEGARAQFRSQMSAIMDNVAPQGSAASGKHLVELQSVLAPLRWGTDPVTPAIYGLVCAIVAVALVNLAGFLLLSATTRQREIGIRLALGATRGRLVRQVLTESCLVSSVAVILSLLAVAAFVPLLTNLFEFPLGLTIDPDRRAYVFLLSAAILVAVGAGLAPIRYVGSLSVVSNITGDGRNHRWLAGPERLRSALVATQVAVSLVLVVAGALLLRATIRSTHADAGFAIRQILTMSGRAYGGEWIASEAVQYWQNAIDRVSSLPSVQGVALAEHVFGGGSSSLRSREGYGVALNRTSAGYFETVGISLLRGRSYTSAEVDQDASVAVVSLKVAQDLWGLESAVGASLSRLDPRLTGVVVGVVSDVLNNNLMELSNPMGTVYRPLAPAFQAKAFLVVRARNDLRQAKRETEQLLPAFVSERPPRFSRLVDEFDAQIRLLRVPSRIALVAGVTVLVLAMVGLQGIAALAVRQRLRDIALRVVLGATPWIVGRYAAGIAAKPAIWGFIVGTAAAIMVIRALSTVLLGVGAFDPPSLLAATLVLSCAVGLGVANPIIRALRVAPADVLRNT